LFKTVFKASLEGQFLAARFLRPALAVAVTVFAKRHRQVRSGSSDNVFVS